MPKKPKYIVNLAEEERSFPELDTHRGKSAARKVKRAQILLKAADRGPDDAIMEALDVSASMAHHTRKLDNRQAAQLIAVSRMTARRTKSICSTSIRHRARSQQASTPHRRALSPSYY